VIRWVPAFVIPISSGGILTTLTDGTNQYYVRPLEIEQRMSATSMTSCSTLSTTDFSGYVLPDSAIWTDPVAYNGSEPALTSAPAVIGGVVQ